MNTIQQNIQIAARQLLCAEALLEVHASMGAEKLAQVEAITGEKFGSVQDAQDKINEAGEMLDVYVLVKFEDGGKWFKGLRAQAKRLGYVRVQNWAPCAPSAHELAEPLTDEEVEG